MNGLIGDKLGQYEIIGALGKGGMANVYRARQVGLLTRNVAIKVLPRQFSENPQFVGRFKQEAELLANLQHPNILPIFDYGEDEGYLYLVMPLIRGGDLSSKLNGNPLAEREIRRWMSQLTEALDYAHSRGLVHRDVKPRNVLLDESGNCLLSDFGIAKIVQSTISFTATGGIIGTPAYMSPEQGHGQEVDARSDIYALGIVLYQMTTGRVPYEADTPLAVILQHVQRPLPPPRSVNPDLTPAVAAVIERALAKDPADRYQTAAAMGQALRRAIPDALPPPAPLSPAPTLAPASKEAPSAKRSRRFRRVSVLLLVAAVAALGVWTLISSVLPRVTELSAPTAMESRQPVENDMPEQSGGVLSDTAPLQTTTITGSPTSAESVDLRLGYTSRADCPLISAIVGAVIEERLGYEVVLVRFSSPEDLYTDLSSRNRNADLTLCFLQPEDNEYISTHIAQIHGVIREISDQQKTENWLIWANESMARPLREDFPCVYDFLGNLTFTEPSIEPADPIRWIETHDDTLESWLTCQREGGQ